MVSMFQNGPVMPHLSFFEESVEDRAESLAKGRAISKSVDMVTVKQPGSKDDVSWEALPWLERLKQNVNWKPEWVERANSMFRQYKEGLEITQVGTHVRTWPPISKAQSETLLAAGVRTVEELAVANEQILTRIGIGARDMKNRAQAWLDAASKDGRAAEELAALRTQNEQQQTQLADMIAKVNQLLLAQGAQPVFTPPVPTAAPAPIAATAASTTLVEEDKDFLA